MPLINVTETTVDQSPSAACWVMSHDGATAAELFEKPEGCTAQSKNLICATTREECLAEAARIGVVVPEMVLNTSNQ